VKNHRSITDRVPWYATPIVWRLDLDGPAGKEVRRDRVLVSTLRDQNAALSPDGAQLAFESNRSVFYEIWVSSPDGGNSWAITSYHSITGSPQWSPDGRQIVFGALKDGRSQVFVMAAGGSPMRQLTSGPAESLQPVSSPDGKWIYYSAPRSGQRQLWRIPASGGTPAQITRNGGWDVAYSPDSHWIYFSHMRAPSASIWRMPADGGDEKMLFDGAIGGHLFATGRRIYYSDNLPGSKNCRIEAYDLACVFPGPPQ
jgi:Tol biopolymer transport system component